LRRQVRLQLELVAFRGLVPIVARARQIEFRRQHQIELLPRRRAQAHGVVLGHGFEPRQRRVDPIIEKIKPQAVLAPLAVAGQTRPVVEIDARAVSEQRRLEVPRAQSQPRQQTQHATVSLVGGIRPVERLDRNVVLAGIGDDAARQIHELHFSGRRVRHRVAVAILPEIIAAHAGARVQPALEKRI
jgi:hypothetical protein